MLTWTEGNRPGKQDTNKFFWLTVREEAKGKTHPVPCRYDVKSENWVDVDGHMLSASSVIAYSKIVQPKPYATIGSGCGYYIRTVYNKEEIIYGFSLQPANWSGKGYASVEKAKAAAKRLKKWDKEDGRERDVYEVVDGNGESVLTL